MGKDIEIQDNHRITEYGQEHNLDSEEDAETQIRLFSYNIYSLLTWEILES